MMNSRVIQDGLELERDIRFLEVDFIRLAYRNFMETASMAFLRDCAVEMDSWGTMTVDLNSEAVVPDAGLDISVLDCGRLADTCIGGV